MTRTPHYWRQVGSFFLRYAEFASLIPPCSHTESLHGAPLTGGSRSSHSIANKHWPVVKVPAGAEPPDIPIEQPTGGPVSLNLKTATRPHYPTYATSSADAVIET